MLRIAGHRSVFVQLVRKKEKEKKDLGKFPGFLCWRQVRAKILPR